MNTSANVVEMVAAPEERRPIAVVDRYPWCDGIVVEIKVPADAEARELGALHYLRFSKGVRGGHIDCFVHTEDLSLCGKKIVAHGEIWGKRLEDGRRFLYVDFFPAEDEIEVTHALAFLPGLPNEWEIPATGNVYTMSATRECFFGSTTPVVGTIVVAEVGVKIQPKVNAPVTPPSAAVIEQPKVIRVSTGDPQLDRLIADGWEIECDDKTTVSLSKMKDGKLKTMTHHRPKKNVKSNKRK